MAEHTDRLVTLTIDGREVSVPEGTTILKAAQSLGIEIPTLCHSDLVEPYGVCRMCIVENVERGRTKVVTSCTTPVGNRMEIRTNSERILRDRRVIAEMLMARCPGSEVIRELGKKVGVKKVTLPTLGDPNEKCMLCGLCVHVCRDVMKVGAIGFANRGGKRIVVTPFEEYSDVCVTCGACAKVCPTGNITLESIAKRVSKNKPRPIADEYEEGLKSRGAAYIPFAQAVPKYPVIDKESCMYYLNGTCKACEKFCKAQALRYGQEDQILDIDVGAVIVAPGFDEFDAKLKPEYGYGRYPNVVTSIQFERIMSASGPFGGHVARPSDHASPKKVAFIQCVGSRDPAVGRGYCSGVCCMYATKEAVIAHEHNPDLESTIFYMDMRSYGKDFDKYIDRAKNEYGVRYVRSRISHVEEAPETKNLVLRYETEEGQIKAEEFDMVVLSVGLDHVKNVEELSKKLGVEMNQYGFAQTDTFNPVETSRKGVFVCGAFQGPKDIPETVTQASGAASKAAGLLHEARGTLVTEKAYPPEIPIDENTEPRIGVFVCHCGINIGGVVRVKEVVEYARKLPNVVYATDNLYTCSADTQTSIQEKIREHNLNRVIIASCTPRTHEPLFRQTVKEAGLNEYLFEMANIRDQCSWVHMHMPTEATEKSKDLVRMAIAKARRLKPLPRMVVDIDHTGIVIGGGVAGMTAALEIAGQGFPVHLIEKESAFGGNFRHVKYLVGGEDASKRLSQLIEKVEHSPNITLHLGSEVATVEGYIGNYKVEIAGTDGKEEINGGAIVVATGANAYQPTEYSYGKSPRIMTQRELEAALADGKCDAQSVVMIQCVGSRNDEHPYCSRICCTNAVKNALKIKELNPKTDVYVLYRDMRTYGLYEDFYREAREKGVIFIRFSKEAPPEVTVDGDKVRVSIYEPLVGARLNLEPDVLALSAGIVADPGAKALAKMLKVPVNQDGFFLEAHMKLRPVDFATEGVFLCGLAHSPKMVDEVIGQACAAAARACTVLAKDQIEAEGAVARVNEELCTKCGICESNCPYAAIAKDPVIGKAHVTEVLCKGCGVCAATCPEKAITLEHYSRDEIREQIAAALEEALT
jgi:heterodisulfide reductase subunit A